MKRLSSLLVCLAACVPTLRQAARMTEIAAVSSLACDGGQSQQFLTESNYSERNPFLPSNPSPGLVWGYLAGVAVATITANRVLPQKAALVVNSIVLATEVWSVEHNMAVGASVCGIGAGGPWGNAALPQNSFSTNTGPR